MEWLGFFMLGFVAGCVFVGAFAVSDDKDIARERIWRHRGKIYRLTEIDALSPPNSVEAEK